jgi:hypothetical protein
MIDATNNRASINSNIHQHQSSHPVARSDPFEQKTWEMEEKEPRDDLGKETAESPGREVELLERKTV